VEEETMALVSDWGFFVKEGTQPAFLEWLDEHEERFGELAPAGYDYIGTYVPLWRGADETAQYHQLWRYQTDRPPDLRQAAAATAGDFTDLARQFLDFVDESRHADESFRLYRSARAVAAEA
jgi:hypothetical protein